MFLRSGGFVVVALTLASCGGDEDAQGSAGAAYGGGAGSEGMAVGGTAGGGGSGGGGDAGSGGAAGSSGAGATAGQGGAPTQPRNVNWELAFETGQLAPKSDGGPDSASLRQSTPGASLVITSISKESPARVSYAGADPAELQGLLIQGVKGMTEVNGLLVRPKKVDAVAHEFRAYLDHEPGGTNPDQTLGTVALDATGFSQYAGGGSLTAFIQDDTLKGGAGPGSGKNCRVTSSDKVGAETVLPREGKYFFRSELHYSYDYAQFVGNSGKNKPRLTLAPPPSVDFDWDDERYAAWSIYIPSDFEDEFATNNNVRDNMVMNIAAPGADTQMSINIRTPSGEKTAHWVVLYYLHPTSTGEGGATQTVVDLGPIAKGKWTDFVLRHRWNPFSTPTNASKHGGVDRVFAGNRGILQLWYGAKAQLELGIDLVNAPVGLVPRDWKKEPLSYSWRQYKYAWHHHTTNVAGPIWIGFDAIREGSTGTDGTEFDDVHPAQASCEAATVAKALCP